MHAEKNASAIGERPAWRDWLVVLAFVLSVPFIIHAVVHVKSNTSDVARWLPSGTPERVVYDRFVEQFGVDEVLIISWEGCNLADPRLAEATAQIRTRLAAPESDEPWIARVTNSLEVWQSLTEPPISLPAAAAVERLHGTMLGRNGGAACIVLHANPVGKSHGAKLVARIEEIAAACGAPAEATYLGGSIFEAVAIDQESIASLKNFVIPSGLVVVILTLLFVRRIQLVLVMLTVSVYCQALSVAVIYYSGGSLDAVLIVMPTLVYVTAMSGALHMINYFLAGVARGETSPTAWMLQRAFYPCVGASVTTAIGLGSLMVSQVEPVRGFGFYASLNILASLIVLLLLTPACLRVSGWGKFNLSQTIGTHWATWRPLAASIEGRPFSIVFVCLLLTGAIGAGLWQLKTSLNLQNMFSSQSRLVRNYQWLEDHIGPLISIEAVVSVRKSANLGIREQIHLLNALERRLRARSEVTATLTPLTFFPPLPTGGSVRATARRSKIYQEFANHREVLRKDGVYAESPTEVLWRVTARLPALAGHQYGLLVDQIRDDGNVVRNELRPEVRQAVSIEITGITPVVYRAQHQILNDLFNSFISAFVLICPLMMLHLRSVTGGLLAMVPNVAPVAIVFGGLGWLDIPIDIGVVLTASVGLGIAVDGTLHFLDWYRAALARGASHSAALLSCFETCAVAMIQTTLIVGLGLLVFALSPFVPTKRFAVLLVLLLFVALAGDLLLLPAILSSALGRFFRVKPHGKNDPA